MLQILMDLYLYFTCWTLHRCAIFSTERFFIIKLEELGVWVPSDSGKRKEKSLLPSTWYSAMFKQILLLLYRIIKLSYFSARSCIRCWERVKNLLVFRHFSQVCWASLASKWRVGLQHQLKIITYYLPSLMRTHQQNRTAKQATRML